MLSPPIMYIQVILLRLFEQFFLAMHGYASFGLELLSSM